MLGKGDVVPRYDVSWRWSKGGEERGKIGVERKTDWLTAGKRSVSRGMIDSI